jgi:hypothetical protein
VNSCVGEFGDDGRLLGFSNIESLHCLLPRPGLVAGFLAEAGSLTGSWTASFGPLLPVNSCVGEFGDDGRLLGLSNIESCLLPKPGLDVAAGFLLVETGSSTSSFGPLALLVISSGVGEFGDDDLLLGLSNIESLRCLLPKPGLEAGFLVEVASWTARFGPLLIVRTSPPSQRLVFSSFLSFFKNVGSWKSSIPIALRFMFTRLFEGNLGGS